MHSTSAPRAAAEAAAASKEEGRGEKERSAGTGETVCDTDDIGVEGTLRSDLLLALPVPRCAPAVELLAALDAAAEAAWMHSV